MPQDVRLRAVILRQGFPLAYQIMLIYISYPPLSWPVKPFLAKSGAWTPRLLVYGRGAGGEGLGQEERADTAKLPPFSMHLRQPIHSQIPIDIQGAFFV